MHTGQHSALAVTKEIRLSVQAFSFQERSRILVVYFGLQMASVFEEPMRDRLKRELRQVAGVAF